MSSRPPVSAVRASATTSGSPANWRLSSSTWGGSNRLYDVATDGVCYQAELIGPALASPWGRWAEFCFDEESGALRLARIRRPSAIDVESINTIRTEVSRADFEGTG